MELGGADGVPPDQRIAGMTGPGSLPGNLTTTKGIGFAVAMPIKKSAVRKKKSPSRDDRGPLGAWLSTGDHQRFGRKR
jgi:hypothetical protein